MSENDVALTDEQQATIDRQIADSQPATFTVGDQRRLEELHTSVTQLQDMFSSLLPMLADSPIGAMLGIKG